MEGIARDRRPLCGDCEFFGDYDKAVVGPWEPVPGTNGRQYRTALLGFDEAAGAICKRPRTGTKTRVYAEVPACPHFEPKTWTRPEYCHDCDRKHGEMTDGSILCEKSPSGRTCPCSDAMKSHDQKYHKGGEGHDIP